MFNNKHARYSVVSTTHLQVPCDEVGHLEVRAVIAKRISDSGSDLEPSHEQNYLKDGEVGKNWLMGTGTALQWEVANYDEQAQEIHCVFDNLQWIINY